MRALKCDNCGCDIPIVTKKDIFGIERKYFDTGNIQLKELKFEHRHMFDDIDLCKYCATEISLTMDYELLKFKSEVLKCMV
jgi:hypothetical protein